MSTSNPPGPPGPPDWRDLLRRLLVDMRVAFDDGATVAKDQLRPLYKRELGPALARENFGDAEDRFTAAHAAAMRLIDGEAPDGGAGPTTH
jgi:hypothetical protein